MNQPRGPADRASVGDALAWIDGHVARLSAEDAAVAEAAGRTLAEDVRAAIDLPPVDRAAVDGLALRADETIGASSYNPLPFRLARAGHDLPPGFAMQLQAGDPLPRGADAVVRSEHVAPDAEGIVAVIEPVVAGNEVERIGSHGARGSRLAAAGRRLSAREVGVLCSAGVARVSVVRRPRVRCLLAGRNLAEGGKPLPPGSTYDANGPLLRALIARDGGIPAEQPRVKRDRAALCEALAVPGADIILVVGGTGPGADDNAAAALSEGGTLAMHGVALRPGETAGMGRTAAGVAVFLLPGAPVACLWAYELIASRAVRRLGGRSPELPFPSRMMTTASKMVSEIGMMEVRPVRCLGDGTAEPIASFSEAGLAALVRADGFVIVPEGSEGYPHGARVAVYLYDEAAEP